MSDQWWALLAGAGTVIALRMLDFFMPKGWVSSWTKHHAERIKDDNGDSGDGDDPHRTTGRLPRPTQGER